MQYPDRHERSPDGRREPAHRSGESRRRLIGRFAALCASALAAVLSLPAVSGGAEAPETNGKRAAEGRLDAEAERAHPQVLLDVLAKIAGDASLRTPEQGKAAAPVIRQLIAALRDASRPFDLPALKRAADLATTKLYYAPNRVQAATGAGAADLPCAAIDLEAAIIERLRTLPPGNGKERTESWEIADRLQHDLPWYSQYARMPAIWDRAAGHYVRLFLPADRPVSLGVYTRFLRSLPPSNAVAHRAVRDSCRQVDWRIDEHSGDAEAAGGESPHTLLRTLRETCTLLHARLTCEEEDSLGLPRSEYEDLRRWEREAIVEPLARTMRHLLTSPMTREERSTCGTWIAEEMRREGIGAVAARVRRWGMNPEDAITALPRPTIRKPAPYGEGPSSSIFLDAFRTVMGDDGLADAYAEKETSPAVRRDFRRNASAVFFTALQQLSQQQEKEENQDIIGMFMILATQAMEEAARSEAFPDLEEWGERAGLYLSVTGGGNGALTAQEVSAARARQLTRILFAESPASPDAAQGIFARFEERLPERLAERYEIRDPDRRARVRGSWLHERALAEGRQRFAAAFLATAPKTLDTAALLCDWGVAAEDASPPAQCRE